MQKKAAEVGGASQYCDLPGTRCLAARWSLMLCIFVLAASAHLAFAASTPPAKNVLVLYSFTDRKAQDDLEILKSATRSHVGPPVDFHVEYLGSARFDAPGYEKAVTESLASVYGGKKIDLVIAALRFAVHHRQELVPGTPIVFSAVPYVGVVLLLVLVQAMLIVGLLWQRARNRKADLRLRESEERFRLMADTTPALVWMCDREGTVTYLNDRRIDFTGRDLTTGFGDAMVGIHSPRRPGKRPGRKQTSARTAERVFPGIPASKAGWSVPMDAGYRSAAG